jgi:hypothetical protein
MIVNCDGQALEMAVWQNKNLFPRRRLVWGQRIPSWQKSARIGLGCR